MRKRDTYWSLFYNPEKRQLNDLRTDHVEAIFEAIPEKDRGGWVVWREGFATWKPFADFPQLIMSLRQIQSPVSHEKIPQAPTAPTENTQQLGKQTSVIETVSFEISQEGEQDDRSPRFPKRWDLRLVAGDRSVSAQTVNVSQNGMQLKSPVPADFPKYFTVQFAADGHQFKLVCSAIKDRNGVPTARIKIEVNDQLHAYNTVVIQS